MLDILRDQDLSGILDKTKISKVLSETEIKQVMGSIAHDVGGGSHSTISDSGKVGAYGFNLEALQTVGAVAPNAIEKTLENIKKNIPDISSLVKKTWVREQASDALGKLGLSGLIGKNLGKNFALDALNKLKLPIPTNIGNVGNNLNFAALADPKIWTAKPGSAAETAINVVNQANGSITSAVSSVKNTLSKEVSGLTTKIALSRSESGSNEVLSTTNKMVSTMTKTLTASATKSATALITNSVKLPSATKVAFELVSKQIDNKTSAVNEAIDVSFDPFRASPSIENMTSAVSVVTGLIDTHEKEITQIIDDTHIEQTANLGGGGGGFLNDPESQNNAMISLLDRNIKSLLSAKAISLDSPKDVIMGMLSVANGQGIDTAIKFANGLIKTSSSGKTSLDFFGVGFSANKLLDELLEPKPGSPTISAPNPAALAQAKPTVANLPTNESLRDADPTKGYKDPNNVYPKKEYLEAGNGDVNALAVGKNPGETKALPEEQTIHGQHDAQRTTSKTIAGRTGESVSQPKSAFAAEYPYNHTYQSESGHTMEFDDTPNAERVSLNHKSGTFQEMRPDGSQVNKIIGDGYTVIDRNGVITIEGKANVHVGGSCNIYVANNCNLTVGGNTAIDTHGNVDWKVGGNMNLAVKGTFATRVDGDYSMDVNGDIDSATSGSWRLGSATSVDILSNSKINIDATSDINIKSDAKANVYGAETNIKASGKTNVQAGSTMNIKGGGATNVDGAVITVNPGSAGSAVTASDGTPPEIIVVADPVSPMTPSEPQFVGGNGGVSPEEARGMDYDGEDGVADRDAAGIEDTPTPGEEGSSNLESGRVAPTACNVTKTGVKLPDINISNGINYGMKISDKFTLKDVMVKGKLRDYGGFTKRDMIANMRCLAVNCLDPIKTKFPGMYFTSGFRDYIPSGGSTTSQHMLGQAVDMKFNGMTKAQYHDVIIPWIVKNVPYDQLLLEYLPSGGHWIHISFKEKGNRYLHFTMYNHKRVSAPGTFKKY
jgi:hypothetical protein